MTRLAKGRLLLALALVSSVALYARTLRFDFVYDDWGQIVRNPHLESAFIPVYFSANVWNQTYAAGQGDYYRPVYLLWLLLNRMLFGISPAGWHATFSPLELAAIFLLYAVCTKLLKDPLGGGIAALLFAAHPANLESIAWVSCSSELLMGALLLLSFFLYMRFRAGGRDLWLATSAVLFAIALGCKETAAAFLLILAWHEWCTPRGAKGIEEVPGESKKPVNAVIALALYVLVAALYFAFRTVALGHMFGNVHTVTPVVAALTAPSALFFYLRHLALPIHLSGFYDLPYTRTFFSASFLLPLMASALVACFIWFFSRRDPVERTAMGWIFLPLLPALAGLKEFTYGDLVHDRYLYLSTMGLAMFVAAAVTHMKSEGWERRVQQILPFAIAGVFICLSATQLGFWKNNLTLYRRGTDVSPRSVLALDNLANELFRQHDIKGAISAYGQSLAVEPNSWKTNFAFAITMMSLREDSQAIHYYSRAIELDPQNIQQYVLLAQTQERQNLNADAERTVIRGLALANYVAQLHFELGSLLEKRGDLKGARTQYEQTLALDPGQLDAASRMSALAELKQAH